jgi:hypothetical protein
MKLQSRFTTTILLAAALLLLTVYLVVVEIPQQEKTKQAEQTADQLFNFKNSDVVAVSLRYPASEIELRKSQDGKWGVTKPLQAEADQREVQSLISTVADIRFSRIVEEQVSNMAEFGLDHPNVDITLTLPDRAERLLIGDDGPMPSTLYIHKDGDPRVVLTQQWIKGSLTRTFYDFRTKIILPIEHEKVNQVQLEFPKRSVLLAKQDARWLLKRPTDGPADEDALNSLTLMLQNLHATFFIDPGPDREKTMKGLKNPLVTVTINESENGAQISRTARFYDAPEKDSVYVVTEPDKPIYRAARVSMDELKPDLFHFQDKHLVNVQPDAVKGIVVHTPTEQYTLASKETGWMTEDETQPVNQDRVKRLLDQIEKLKAFQAPEKPVKNPAAVGLKPATYEIQLVDQMKKTLAALQLGNELKGMLYARGNTRLGIVLVNKDFLDEIPKKSELLKKEEPAKEKK